MHLWKITLVALGIVLTAFLLQERNRRPFSDPEGVIWRGQNLVSRSARRTPSTEPRFNSRAGLIISQSEEGAALDILILRATYWLFSSMRVGGMALSVWSRVNTGFAL